MDTDKEKRLKELFNEIYTKPDHLDELIIQSIQKNIEEKEIEQVTYKGKTTISKIWLIISYALSFFIMIVSILYFTKGLKTHSTSWMIVLGLLIIFVIDHYMSVQKKMAS